MFYKWQWDGFHSLVPETLSDDTDDHLGGCVVAQIVVESLVDENADKGYYSENWVDVQWTNQVAAAAAPHDDIEHQGAPDINDIEDHVDEDDGVEQVDDDVVEQVDDMKNQGDAGDDMKDHVDEDDNDNDGMEDAACVSHEVCRVSLNLA